jgi:hypothetical protein
MPGTSEQWSALDRQNERLVDAGGQQAPAGPQPDSQSPDDGRSPGSGPEAADSAGRYRMRTRTAAAAVAAVLAGAGRRPRAVA